MNVCETQDPSSSVQPDRMDEHFDRLVPSVTNNRRTIAEERREQV